MHTSGRTAATKFYLPRCNVSVLEDKNRKAELGTVTVHVCIYIYINMVAPLRMTFRHIVFSLKNKSLEKKWLIP